jgi:DNA-binding SARP family transcriptional activator
MRLILLGELTLEPSTFTRPKPLLLLAYLSLEGPRSRRDVAELFWQGSKDPMQGLRMALLQLNREVPGAIQSDEKRVWTELTSDVVALHQHLSNDELATALELYRGTFIDGFDMQDVGEELEEWIFQTRELLAKQIREVLLELAERDAAQRDYSKAASRAEEAYLLRFAPEPDSAVLSRVYTLLRADENSQAESVAKEAKAYGLELSLTPQAAKVQLLSLTDSPSTPKRRATDFLTTDKPAEVSPTTLVVDNVVTQNILSQNVMTNHLRQTATDITQPALHQSNSSLLRRLLPLLALVLVLGLVLAFFGLRSRTTTTPVVARNAADDSDVALGDNYFCPAHSNLFLSSAYDGQSTALRFRDVGIPKPNGNTITIQSALILFTASAHIPEVPEGSGFIVRGLFDSSPWLVNDVCEQKHPAAGDNFVSRVRTKASVVYKPEQWNITEQYSVDVTQIVQEMVDSPDWSGDGVAFAVDKLQNSNADLKAYSNEGGILLEDLSRQPQFVVTFRTQ